ncbi:MAG TPA: hypothetical protein ENK19_01545 [Acidobacteria bacterium]|nr:hypothetical protein [Acidobacteriota bacterium]
MGKLIDRDRRDRARADRRNRQAAILEKARTALLSQQPGELTLEALDRAAGLRQGAASMYFGSLEGLVFRLLRDEISSWLQRLESLLRDGPATLPPLGLAEALATTLQERPLLSRLLAALPALADRRSAEMDQILDLETWRLERFREAGSLVESRCPDLQAGGGVVILRRAVLLAAALEPLLNPPSGLLLAINDANLAPLYPPPGEELRVLLAAILADMSRTT